MGRAVRPNERERMSQSVHWRISYLLTVNGSGKRRRPPSRIIGGQRSDSSGKNSKPPSAQFAEWSEWDERPVFATLRRGKHRRSELSTASLRPDWRKDEGRSEVRAGLALRAANEFQIGNKVKQLRPGPTGHKFRGAALGAPRKNRTSETRRLARSIRDVAAASRREFVAEARPRCGSGDRLTWTQPFARQAQLFGQTTRRICSLEIAAEEMSSESGPGWRSSQGKGAVLTRNEPNLVRYRLTVIR
jgi:hypothetical protein